MFKEAMKHMKTALILLIVLTCITGLFYPLAVTGLAQLLFPGQANGSLIKQNNQVIGSRFIGQSFSSPAWFWGRPSATKPYPYNGAASSGSNSGPTNPDFLATVKERVIQLKETIPQNSDAVPVDLVTASGSGLDPDISPYAAYYQSARIAKAHNLPLEEIKKLIQTHIKNRTMGILGEPRVNVLELNLALDNLRISHGQPAPKS